jgi:hypothetical protein
VGGEYDGQQPPYLILPFVSLLDNSGSLARFTAVVTIIGGSLKEVRPSHAVDVVVVVGPAVEVSAVAHKVAR